MAAMSSQVQARKKFAVGKLIALTGPETGVGRSVCAVSIAISLAQRWRCLALDLDTATRTLQTYFGLHAATVDISEFLENPANSLETIQARTRVTNLDCIGWSVSGGNLVGLGPQRIDSLLRCMQSHPADYVFATLPAGTTEDTIELFTSADIPIVVTPSTPALLEKVLEFLRHCAPIGFDGRSVYLVVNRVQRGGEVREASELVEKVRDSLGLSVSILGTIQYDHQLEASFRPGSALSVQRSQTVTALAFENIAVRIERLLPRGRLDTATGRRLQHQHQNAVGELQQIIQNKNDEIAGNNAIIRELEERNQLYTSRLAERERLLEEKDRIIHDFGERLAQLTAAHARATAEVMETVRHLAEEIRVQREQLVSAIESCRSFVSGSENRVTESELRQEISQLQELQKRKDEVIAQLERKVRVLESEIL
jgi:MinD-like ATPase involved in chromosome partitioning or flagellar assembly